MPFGDRRYRLLVPREAQNFIAENGLPTPDSFLAGAEHPPYYPDSIRAIVFGDLLPEDLASKLGVPRDVGRVAVDAESAHHEPNGVEQTGHNGNGHNGASTPAP